MSQPRPQRIGQGAIALLRTLGGLNPWTIVLAAIVILLSGAAGDALQDLYTVLGWDGPDSRLPKASFLAVSLLALLLFLLLRQARAQAGRITPEIVVDNNPAPVRALIVVLSAATPAKGRCFEDLDGVSGTLDQPATRGAVEDICRNWRMPLEAIAHHMQRLEVVVLVTTSGKEGSHRQLETFTGLAQRLLPANRQGQLRFPSVGSFLNDGRFRDGVDVTNASEVFDAIGDAHEQLRASYPERDILIDLTGGTKLSTGIAALVAARITQRSFQYVDTGDKQVRTYDVTFSLD